MNILFKNNSPVLKSVNYSVKNNNIADRLNFILDNSQEGITLSNYRVYVKVQSSCFLDKEQVTGEVSGEKFVVTWYLKRKVTAYKTIQVQLQFEDNNGLVWQTEIFSMNLANTIPADKEISDKYPTILEQLENRIEDVEEDITELDQKAVTDLDMSYEDEVLTVDLINKKEEVVASQSVVIDTSSKLQRIIKIKYQRLLQLKTEGLLIPGQQYRIIDYITTTGESQTQSAGNQFDLIVIANDSHTLSEIARAIMHENIYNVTFDDGVTKRCYVFKFNNLYNFVDIETMLGISNIDPSEFEFIDDENITTQYYASWELSEEDLQYNYFQYSKLEAWKIKYCLENDINRFGWALPHAIVVYCPENDEYYVYARYPELDNENGFAWAYQNEGVTDFDGVTDWSNIVKEDLIYSQSIYPQIDEILDMGGIDVIVSDTQYHPSGVIYEMIDEFNNECPYDFKNMQFYRNDTPTQIQVTEAGYFYTFEYIDDINQNQIYYDLSLNIYDRPHFNRAIGCHGNVIKPYYDQSNLNYDVGHGRKQYLNKINFINYWTDDPDLYETCCCYSNYFDFGCRNIVFGKCSSLNTFECDCRNIKLIDNCNYNHFEKNCYNITFLSVQNPNVNRCRFCMGVHDVSLDPERYSLVEIVYKKNGTKEIILD